MTFEEKINEIKLLANKRVKLERDFAIEFQMTDEGFGGVFYMANKDGKFSVEPYDYLDRDATFTASSSVIEGLLLGEISPETAISEGLVEIDGDMEAVREMLKKCRKKKAGKATSEKSSSKQKKEE